MRQRFYVSYAALPAGLQSGIVASMGYLHCTAPIQSEWKEDTTICHYYQFRRVIG